MPRNVTVTTTEGKVEEQMRRVEDSLQPGEASVMLPVSLLPQNHGWWLASDLVCEPPSEKSGDLRVADVNAARVIELPLNGVATDAWATMGPASGAIHERRMLPP